MKTILVATDFSTVAQRAATYAADLAQKLEAGLVLCHVVADPIVSEPQAFGSAAQTLTYRRQASGKELQELADDLICRQQQRTGQKIAVDTVTLQGDVAGEIIELAKTKRAGLVVVGAHEEGTFADLFLGNHTSEMIEHCRLPVLVVPNEEHLGEIRTILYACDLLETDTQHLRWLSELARRLQARILVVHVSEAGDLEKEYQRMDQFVQQLTPEITGGNFSFRLISGRSIATELKELLATESVDLLAMATKKRNLFQQLAHRSLSKRMAGKPEIPVLVFHANRMADIWFL